MSDFIPKPADIKARGLGPKAQKLRALREKAEANTAGNSAAEGSTSSVKTKGLAGTRKTSFNRKAV